MLSRLFTMFFIGGTIFALWYQRAYLEKSSREFNAKLNAENSVLETSVGTDFKTLTYKNSLLKSSLSGQKITYYNDGHFVAVGNLNYQEYDEKGRPTVSAKTDKGIGKMLLKNNDNTNLISANKKVKSLLLPNVVEFNFNGNVGHTKNVMINVLDQKIRSDEAFESNGDQGRLAGKGFRYNIKTGDFKILANVNGEVILNKDKEKDNDTDNETDSDKEKYTDHDKNEDEDKIDNGTNDDDVE